MADGRDAEPAGDDGAGDTQVADDQAAEGGSADDPVADDKTSGDPVERGLALIECFADDELSVADTITRLESITSHPRTQRRILDAAVERGLVEREGSRIRPIVESPIDFEQEIIRKEGDFTCKRCGTGITTGYFLNLHTGELGPFGSSCIRKVTGRD